MFRIEDCGRDEKGRAMVTHPERGDGFLLCDHTTPGGCYVFIDDDVAAIVDPARLTPRRAKPKIVLPEKVWVRIFYDLSGEAIVSHSDLKSIAINNMRPRTDHTFDPRLIPIDQLIAAGSPWPDYDVRSCAFRLYKGVVGATNDYSTDSFPTHHAAHLRASELHLEKHPIEGAKL